MSTDTSFKPCKHCLEGFKLDGEPQGETGELGGLAYYVARGKNADRKKAILLGTDIFGFGIPNSKLMADSFAVQTGLDIFVPDMFEGDYIDTSRIQPQLARMEEPMKPMSIFGKIKSYAMIAHAFFWVVGAGYLKRHNKDHVYPLVEKFVTDLKDQQDDERLGWVGYCFGGMIGVHLAKDPSPIDVVVALHAGSVTAKDFAEIRKPFALICSEEDLGFDPVKTAALAELKKLQTPVIVHDAHPGTTHGFAIRPNLAEPLVKTAFERAMVQTTECFAKEV